MSFFDIGPGEVLIILFVALLLFGPAKIIGIARSLGKWVHDFQKAASNFTAEVNKEIDEAGKDVKETANEMKADVSGVKKEVSGATAQMSNELNSAVAGAKREIGSVTASPVTQPMPQHHLPQSAPAVTSGVATNPPAKL